MFPVLQDMRVKYINILLTLHSENIFDANRLMPCKYITIKLMLHSIEYSMSLSIYVYVLYVNISS